MQLNGAQAAFARALLSVGEVDPELRLAHSGDALVRRFDVYRNNVSSSLVSVLAARYPALLSLLGETFFRGIAREFVCAHPPRSPVLLEYGDGFAAYLAAAPEAQDVPYAADVARLEWAIHDASHAADAQPATLLDLAALPAAQLESTRLTLHPAVRLVASDYPVLSIWRAATSVTADGETELSGAEHIFVARPESSVTAQAVSPGFFAFAMAIAAGRTLASAVPDSSVEFDLAQGLSQLFAAGGVCGVSFS
jgi:hypothetical protein